MPLTLPPGVRLVVSFKPEAPLGVEALRLLREAGAVLGEVVPPFDRPEDRRRLVRAYLSQYLKELDEEHIEALIAVEGASRPLFLKVVLSELRVFGAFANLGEKIARDFGRTPVEAFESVLRRLESDPAYAPLEPAYAVPRLFGLLAHARRGVFPLTSSAACSTASRAPAPRPKGASRPRPTARAPISGRSGRSWPAARTIRLLL